MLKILGGILLIAGLMTGLAGLISMIMPLTALRIRRRWQGLLVFGAGIGLIGLAVNMPDDGPPVSVAAAAARAIPSAGLTVQPAQPTAADLPELPPNEPVFLDTIREARDAAAAAKNDMQLSTILAKRTQALCELLRIQHADHWHGTVLDVGVTQRGNGYLLIEMPGKIRMGTFSSEAADETDRTLLRPLSNVFTAASKLAIGDRVVFSGRFAMPRQIGGCFKEMDVSLRQRIDEPHFLMRFTDIVKE